LQVSGNRGAGSEGVPTSLKTIGLENEQVWRLKEKSTYRFKEGQQVKIVRGFLGSTILIDAVSGKRFKVKRER